MSDGFNIEDSACAHCGVESCWGECPGYQQFENLCRHREGELTLEDIAGNFSGVHTFDEYQRMARGTATYPDMGGPMGFFYLVSKLAGETGEVLGKFAEQMPEDDFSDRTFLTGVQKELGDITWYVAMICSDMGLAMSDIVDPDRLAEYQAIVRDESLSLGGGSLTAIFSHTSRLTEATGRVSERFGKQIRDHGADFKDEAFRRVIAGGLGAVVKHITLLCVELGLNLEDVFRGNLAKLYDRKARGVLGGSGDNR